MSPVITRFALLLSEKERKEKKKYSYQDVADKTGIAKSTLSKWATNKVTKFDAETIDKLCGFLECQPGDLLIRVDD
ncbi:MAG TPA: XRE family transcriptional regulator [Fibrobacteres bacterium]|nr:XRE family transcriptional regulator [Fibrobacterota bacterium]